jgi:hypothetical protein
VGLVRPFDESRLLVKRQALYLLAAGGAWPEVGAAAQKKRLFRRMRIFS